MRKLLLALTLTGAALVAPGLASPAHARVAFRVGAGFHAGPLQLSLVFGQPLHAPRAAFFYRSVRPIVFPGYSCNQYYVDGGYYYYDRGCPLVTAYFRHYNLDPNVVFQRYAPRVGYYDDGYAYDDGYGYDGGYGYDSGYAYDGGYDGYYDGYGYDGYYPYYGYGYYPYFSGSLGFYGGYGRYYGNRGYYRDGRRYDGRDHRYDGRRNNNWQGHNNNWQNHGNNWQGQGHGTWQGRPQGQPHGTWQGRPSGGHSTWQGRPSGGNRGGNWQRQGPSGGNHGGDHNGGGRHH
jgi:hypothetical protein